MNYYNSETLLEQQSEIDNLREQNSALAAQVEVLRDALQSVMASICGGKKFCGHEFDCICAGDKARAARAATPQQHLAEIRAEAGRAGFVAGSEQTAQFITGEIGYALPLLEARANQYAEQIRRGEVK